jgi:hypothetical protein
MDCFYTDGLRFECTGCRYCCGVEPGYVFLSSEDLQNLCGYLGIAEEEFMQTYCRLIPMGSISYVSLLEKERYDCVFLTGKGCQVYEARPLQCRTYPFWASIVEDKESWNLECASCPGIGKGRLYSKQEIIALLEMRAGVEPLTVENRSKR